MMKEIDIKMNQVLECESSVTPEQKKEIIFNRALKRHCDNEIKAGNAHQKSITSKDIKLKYYVSSKLFRQQLEKYYEDDIMSNELALNIVKIAEGLSYNYRFINYTWRDEMVGDAILKMYAALEDKKFRIDSEFNPFSYFNQIAWNAFSNRIKKEKRQHEGLEEYKQMVYENEMSDSSHGNVYVRPMLEHDTEDGSYD
jgi:hypothetical protein